MPYNVSVSPWASGTLPTSGPANAPNVGVCILQQSANIGFGNTLVSQQLLYIPPGSKIVSIYIDVLTAFNSASSATVSIGVTSGGTDYVSGINAKVAGRATITYTAAQLAAMSNQTLTGGASPTPTSVYITVTSVGQPTAGYLTAGINYQQLSTPN